MQQNARPSVFDLRCSECLSMLVPHHSSVWRCKRCHRRYEVCGNYLVEVAPTASAGAGQRLQRS